jgi:anaerobic selenocysteine-containing dehydrogenase
VPVKPGTEAVLAFGIANYLISEKNRTANVAEFGKWSSVIINQYPLPVVAKITGVSENKIKEIAEGLLAATNPVVIGGRGAQGISSSSTELIAVQLLNLLINSRAVTLKLRSGLGNVTLNDRKSAGLDDFIRSGNFEMLFVNGANPVHKSVNGAVLAEKMNGAFVVSFSQLKTDTAVYSDYILPTLSFLEVAGAEGEAIVSGITDGKHAGDAIIAIAQMVDKTKDAFTWKSFTECVPITGNARPAGEFSIKPEETLKKYIADSTKASDDAVKYPLGLIPIEIPCVGDGDGMAFPYTLKILDRYTFSNGKLWVLMNRKTADREGISEGEKIDIESKRGEIGSVKVHLTDTVAPDVIAIPLGFGHDAYTNYAEGKGVNPKAIMNDTIDPLSGAADWWMTMVKIS